jgi:hypothetical protein
LSTLLLLAGCASQTLFQSNFDTPVGQPPAQMQAVGTAGVFGPPGGNVIVPSPVTTGGRWLQVNRTTADTGMQGKFSQFLGDGFYTFDATLFIPSGTDTASLSFEPSTAQLGTPFENFMHLDFLPSNRIRIDDITDTDLTFPRDQPFLVQVTLQIGAPKSTAHIVLAGAGTSGTADYTILPPFQQSSRDFGAIRIWMGFDHHGPFDATNVVVTRRIQ